MGRKKNKTSEMDVAEKQARPLAKRLSELITDKNALRDHLGVSAQAINQYLLGESYPSLENLCKIADFYGVSTDYLLGRTDTKTLDVSVQAACETTGLSESAVRQIKYILLGPVFKDELNNFICSECFRQIITCLFHFRRNIKEMVSLLEDMAADLQDIQGRASSSDLFEYRASKSLSRYFDDIRESELSNSSTLVKNSNGHGWQREYKSDKMGGDGVGKH